MYKKVNVDGTQCVIEACQKTGVKALVYTSSASVISDNATDLINADERWPVIPPKAQTEYYSQTKVCYTPHPLEIPSGAFQSPSKLQRPSMREPKSIKNTN